MSFFFSFSLCFPRRFLARIGIEGLQSWTLVFRPTRRILTDLSTVKLETKNRSKTLVNVVETQNILLRRLVLKIEPEAEVIIGRDRYLELITSGSDLFSLSFSLLSVIHLSISATQCSTLDLNRPASTSQLVLKVTYNCETSAEKWYYRL